MMTNLVSLKFCSYRLIDNLHAAIKNVYPAMIYGFIIYYFLWRTFFYLCVDYYFRAVAPQASTDPSAEEPDESCGRECNLFL